ncbi:hypothetical protein BC628DRAFT_616851 [Trametes gibbosa]|nr:hypothetical protein BC628DRAFT_616851 [Trametes gibbosa]
MHSTLKSSRRQAHRHSLCLAHRCSSTQSRSIPPCVSGRRRPSEATASDADEPGAEPVEVGRKEMFEQREKLEALIFEAPSIDVSALESYLLNLFSEPDGQAALTFLRNSIVLRTERLLKETISGDDVKWIIKSILDDANVSDTKRVSLRGFLENKIILDEIASVLTVNVASLASWTWADGGVLMEMRRALNGKYRAATDPYVGLKLQPIFKDAFRTLYHNKAVWKDRAPRFTKEQNVQWQKSIGTVYASIALCRMSLQHEQFIAGQLVDSVDQANKEMAGYREGANDDAASEIVEEEAPATTVPQALLHLVSTECQLARLLHGQFTVLTTDLRWFGPSLAHESILTIMKFLGLPEPWLTFLHTFLRMPLRFGTDASVRRTQLFLWRNHDDVWLFDVDSERCAAAWTEMQHFAGLTGLEFNDEKTGSASVGGNLHPGLPRGDVRWGFLKFNPEDARFDIDQDVIDKHIEELGRQLRAARTVFSKVNVWNKYLAFIKCNCGDRPARCLGYDHARAMAHAIARVQKSALPGGGDIVSYLRTIISERFGVGDLPEGWFYIPMRAGGLDLRSPLAELFAVMDALRREKTPASFDPCLEEERVYYRNCQKSWEAHVDNISSAGESFISWEEYIRGREAQLHIWAQRYDMLKRIPLPSPVHKTPAVEALLARSNGNWDSMSFFDKWVVSTYGEEVAHKFGSFDPVDSTLIPLGMVNVFTQSRMKWDQ